MIKVDAMRTIDRYAGVPICFLLSVVNSIFTITRKQTKPDTSKTLFIELSEMGSAVIADPAMRKLQRETNAELFFVIFKSNQKSLDILHSIPTENIFTLRAENLFTIAVDVVKFMVWCRQKKISCTIDLELFSRFTAILSLLSGATYRAGFASFHDEGLYRGNLINLPVRYNPHVHVSVNFVSLVNRVTNRFTNPYATVALQPSDTTLARASVAASRKQTVEKKLHDLIPNWRDERIVLFNVNASDLLPQRRWMQENFAATAKQLLQTFDNIIVVATGAPAEKEYVQHFVDLTAHERCVNASGLFAFDELVPLYSISHCMLTNDSGPAHFASVTDLKVFVLFGPETPELYLPIGGNAEPFYLGLPCSPCVSAANHRKTSCETRPCITGISVERVSGRLKEYLA